MCLALRLFAVALANISMETVVYKKYQKTATGIGLPGEIGAWALLHNVSVYNNETGPLGTLISKANKRHYK